MKSLLTGCLLGLMLFATSASAMPRLDGAIPQNQARQFARAAQPRPASVVHTVTTRSGNSTLSIALAGAALGVALGAAGYVVLRRRPMPRAS
jgi:hypothetical protein